MADGVKSFSFASKKLTGPKIIGQFEIDGVSYDVVAQKDSAVAWLVHRTQSGGNNETIAGVLDFTERALTKESAKRFEARVLGTDGSEGLDMEQIVQVFQHILTLVSTFPTGSAQGSSTSSEETGTGSRATTRARRVAAS